MSKSVWIVVAVLLAIVAAAVAAVVARRPHGAPASAAIARATMPSAAPPLCPPPAAPLPPTLTPPSADLDGVLRSLDTALLPAHVEWIRCFDDEDRFVGAAQNGLGRWLRRRLHLFADTPLVTAFRTMGLSDPDDMSSLILRMEYRLARGEHPVAADVLKRVRPVRQARGAS